VSTILLLIPTTCPFQRMPVRQRGAEEGCHGPHTHTQTRKHANMHAPAHALTQPTRIDWHAICSLARARAPRVFGVVCTGLWEFDEWNRPLKHPDQRDPRFLLPYPPEFAMRLEVCPISRPRLRPRPLSLSPSNLALACALSSPPLLHTLSCCRGVCIHSHLPSSLQLHTWCSSSSSSRKRTWHLVQLPRRRRQQTRAWGVRRPRVRAVPVQ